MPKIDTHHLVDLSSRALGAHRGPHPKTILENLGVQFGKHSVSLVKAEKERNRDWQNAVGAAGKVAPGYGDDWLIEFVKLLKKTGLTGKINFGELFPLVPHTRSDSSDAATEIIRKHGK